MPLNIALHRSIWYPCQPGNYSFRAPFENEQFGELKRKAKSKRRVFCIQSLAITKINNREI